MTVTDIMNILMPSVILHGLYDYIVCFELFGDGLDTHVASVSYSGCRWMESLFLCCHFHLCVDFYDDLLFDDQRMAISTATISFPTNQTISYSRSSMYVYSTALCFRFIYFCCVYCYLVFSFDVYSGFCSTRRKEQKWIFDNKEKKRYMLQ